MSSDKNALARLFCLWASVGKLVVDGKRSAEKVANVLQQIVDEVEENPYLCQIATGKIGKTTGQRTLAKAKKLFSGWLDHDFTNWGTDVPSAPTEEADFVVHEQVKDGTFKQIFEAFGVDLGKLCWSQDQIISFVENHADKLHPQGYSTFFLFKTNNQFFVASVLRGRFKARVNRLSNDSVWSAENRYRFVVPQLTV